MEYVINMVEAMPATILAVRDIILFLYLVMSGICVLLYMISCPCFVTLVAAAVAIVVATAVLGVTCGVALF